MALFGQIIQDLLQRPLKWTWKILAVVFIGQSSHIFQYGVTLAKRWIVFQKSQQKTKNLQSSKKNLENIKKISKKLSESLFFNIKSDTPRDKYLKKWLWKQSNVITSTQTFIC